MHLAKADKEESSEKNCASDNPSSSVDSSGSDINTETDDESNTDNEDDSNADNEDDNSTGTDNRCNTGSYKNNNAVSEDPEDSLKRVLFPYNTVRPFQEDMLLSAKNAFENRKHILITAPTGVGKTSILGPAIAASLSDPNTRKVVFFLTSRHMQHVIAVDTVRQIKKKYGLKLIAADIIGRQSMCCLPGAGSFLSSDFQEYCNDARQEYTCEHYVLTRKKGGAIQPESKFLVEELQQISPVHAEKIMELCRPSNYCPYEICTALAANANIVIADYYHIFHPHIRSMFLKKADLALSDCIIIVDEAHNLGQRIRKVLSSRVTNFSLKRAVREARRYNFIDETLYLAGIMSALYDLSSKMVDGQEILVAKEQFIALVETKTNRTLQEITAELELCAEFIRKKQKKSRLGGVASFLSLWQGHDTGFARILSLSGFGREMVISLAYKCLDPSIVSKEVMEAAHSVAMMSATLSPQSMYSDILGFPKERTIIKDYANPFPKKNRLNLIVPLTTTKYSERSPALFREIAKVASNIVNIVPGNALLFFPSYAVRDSVKPYFIQPCEKTIFFEAQGMTKKDKAELLEKFKEYKSSGKYAVLMAVASGSFGEGIDLPGLLSCVIVIGLPLQQPDLETKELISYYDQKFSKGWDYGYIMPAMNKAVQAVGRCIRSETDKGVLVFLDKRFAWDNYKKCFPKDWDIKVSADFSDQINIFFQGLKTIKNY